MIPSNSEGLRCALPTPQQIKEGSFARRLLTTQTPATAIAMTTPTTHMAITIGGTGGCEGGCELVLGESLTVGVTLGVTDSEGVSDGESVHAAITVLSSPCRPALPHKMTRSALGGNSGMVPLNWLLYSHSCLPSHHHRHVNNPTG